MYIIYADTYTYYTFVYISTCMSSASSVFFVLAGEIWQPSKAPLCLYLNKCCTTSSVWYKNLSVWGQNSWGTWSRASCPKAFFWHPEDTVPRTVFFCNLWNEKRKQLKRMTFQAASICEEAAFVPKGALGVWSPNNKNKTPGKLDELFLQQVSKMLRYILGKQLGNIQMIAEKASREATLSCGVHVFGPVAEQMSLGLALPWLWLFLHCLNCWKLRLK